MDKYNWESGYVLKEIKHICKGTPLGFSTHCEKQFTPDNKNIFVCNNCKNTSNNLLVKIETK
jgi:hypothetical protein